MRKTQLYPGVQDVEAEKNRRAEARVKGKDHQPDFIGGAPNYDKFDGWSPEEVLAWLNID